MTTKVKIASAIIFPIYIIFITVLAIIVILGWMLMRVLDFFGIIQAIIYLLEQTSERLRLNQIKKHIQ